MRTRWTQLAGAAAIALLCIACNREKRIQRTLRAVGTEHFRAQTLAVCREGFAAGGVTKIDAARWPEPARAFQPLGLWAEPDGTYLLLDSDADGERGIFLPRILSEKDPVCSPALQHRKLDAGIYWYERRR